MTEQATTTELPPETVIPLLDTALGQTAETEGMPLAERFASLGKAQETLNSVLNSPTDAVLQDAETGSTES
jgi:hypothetical protein